MSSSEHKPVRLMSSTHGGIELVLLKYSDRYQVVASDAEGPLTQAEFRYWGGELRQTDSTEACASALELFERSAAVIAQYVEQPSALSVRELVNTMYN